MKLTLLPLENDSVIRVRCEGPITLRHRTTPTDPLEELLGPSCFALRVVLNLERTRGVDTSGVNWLARCNKRFMDAKGRLVLVAVPPGVTQILDFLRLTPLLQMAPTEVAARDVILGAVPPNGEQPPDGAPGAVVGPGSCERPPHAG